MAGKIRYGRPKDKRKTGQGAKKATKADPKQTKLTFISKKASTPSEEHVALEQPRKESTDDELRQRLSGSSFSTSSGRKRTCPNQDGPSPKKMHNETLENIDEECFSETFDSDCMEDDDFANSSDLENVNFVAYQEELKKAVQAEAVNKPPELDDKFCTGLGDPSQIWNLMCKKDDLDRIDVEKVRGNIDSSMRAILVDWMMEVCESEKQHREMFHLAVNYLDRSLAAETVAIRPMELQCIGTTALFLASKYEEIYPPKLEQFVEYTDNACSNEQVEIMEKLMLNKLDWSLNVMTSIHWLSTYFQLMGSRKINDEEHYDEKPTQLPRYLRDQFMTMANILDLAVLDGDHLQFSYRELAAAVLFQSYEPHSLIERVTGFKYCQMQPVIEWILPCYKYCATQQKAGNPLPAVSEVNSDEWHDIQTHGISVEHGYTQIRVARRQMERQREEQRKRLLRSAQQPRKKVFHRLNETDRPARPLRLSL